jgi:fructose-bisphosphate aldolase class I
MVVNRSPRKDLSMNKQELNHIAKALVAPGKGILAADESSSTCKKRFDSIGVESTEEKRRDYREMLFTTPGVAEFISGVILYDETIRQKALDGTPFVKILQKNNVIPGIKVDNGAKPLPAAPGETITEGLDGLRERLKEYHEMGARFAKWRAVIDVSATLPSDYALRTNAHALARYAALCQEANIVPIVEPEVLMDGDHTIDRCYEVTERTLNLVFNELRDQRVALEGMILKPNMVIAGKKCKQQATVQQVAEYTVRCFLNTVPAAVPGIAFLSGGQSDAEATAHLSAMNALDTRLPWQLTFSYGRALQNAALKTWAGNRSNFDKAQKAFFHRSKLNSAARYGKYASSMENELR